MQSYPPHLNLLKKGEQLSSSPVRLRVMGPVLALFACLGVAVWWGITLMQSLLVESQLKTLTIELENKSKAHATILDRMARLKEMNAECEQLAYYRAGRAADYAGFLAQLAEVLPPQIQLLSISIPAAPAPAPLAKKDLKGKGPQKEVIDICETTKIRLVGKTPSDAPVKRLMDVLKGSEFTNVLVHADGRAEGMPASPRINKFQQADGATDGERLLEFDIEYTCLPRRFAK